MVEWILLNRHSVPELLHYLDDFWGSHWSRKHVLFRSDNQSVVALLTSRTSKVPALMHLLRDLLLSAARCGFFFSSVYHRWCNFSFSLAGVPPLGPRGSAESVSYPTASPGQLNTSVLEERCRHFLVRGLAPSTRKSYASGQRKFYDFCLQAGKLHSNGSPCPAEWTWSGRCACSFRSSQLQFSIHLSKFISPLFALFTSSKAFLTR